MEKTCFIIMPISDHGDYPKGHFKRVYDFLIKPACEAAGFKPIRADDILNTNYIALDIVKNIINADMALCDLSSRNPNVLYELGIRQAFNKPVTLIKDSKTQRIFDISGFRDVEYDESLRIDSVQTNIDVISDTIKNTFESSGTEINSLISLLGIEPAKIEKNVQISIDTELIINAINNLDLKVKDLYKRNNENVFDTDVPAYIEFTNGELLSQDEVMQLKKGDRVNHIKAGKGTILNILGSLHNPIAEIEMDNGENKKFMLNYAKFIRS